MLGKLTIINGDNGMPMDTPIVHSDVELEIDEIRATADRTGSKAFIQFLYYPKVRTGLGNVLVIGGIMPTNGLHSTWATQEWRFEPNS